jgi:15-cis-phytoene desaturase
MRRRVIVIGGGVAGMSAAHELAVRDEFDVVVYELRSIPGGKARSMPAKPGTDGGRCRASMGSVFSPASTGT